mmetsp:Transcript_7532/g.20051  ORF Transcript_7532/g.20051 Transcript_7532/m.20051 type:complete len:240 (-) Transcript_7532:357-1076(-)
MKYSAHYDGHFAVMVKAPGVRGNAGAKHLESLLQKSQPALACAVFSHTDKEFSFSSTQPRDGCTEVHTHTCTHAHAHTHTQTHTHICTHAHTHTHTCTHVRAHTHTHTHTTHKHMHVHTQSSRALAVHYTPLLHRQCLVGASVCALSVCVHQQCTGSASLMDAAHGPSMMCTNGAQLVLPVHDPVVPVMTHHPSYIEAHSQCTNDALRARPWCSLWCTGNDAQPMVGASRLTHSALTAV